MRLFSSDLDRRGLSLMQANIRLDLEIDIYERQVYSFFDLVYQIGGLFNATTMLGVLLTQYLLSNLLYSSLVTNIF